MKKNTLTVIDFFSGAGGFSEGFRQQGFKIVKGIDRWEPAVKTHNLNHGLEDTVENVLDYAGSNSSDVERIETLPDVDVIIGSPSCVTFSMSNKGGKADKTEGLRLIEAYLRVIAVKKHKQGSRLKAWLMENVPNSGNYVKHDYTFKDLNLEDWASANSLEADSVALTLNGTVLNASDYGAPQNRSRFICGETISDGKFPAPKPTTHIKPLLKDIRLKMPKPSDVRPKGSYEDPNYPGLIIEAKQISDHFYDTGLYVTQWEQSKYLKTMHPFMGRMSFPEADENSSRTVTATRSISSRESLIYKSEYDRTGHGEYRTPTIREAASLMGYPYTYQFFGSEGVKWKLIGNSVSPHLSSALASAMLVKEGRKPVAVKNIPFEEQKELYLSVDNLNTFSPIKFDQRKLRKPGAKFRRSVYKGQNMTVDLLNYNPSTNDTAGIKWYVGTFYGTGSDHKYDVLKKGQYSKLAKVLGDNFDLFDEFRTELEKFTGNTSMNARTLQQAYETDSDLADKQNPLVIIERIRQLTNKYGALQPDLRLELSGMHKQNFLFGQLLCLFSLGHIVYNNLVSEPRVVSENSLAFGI
ncbi:MAG: cytosine methyltransferase [Candidatus Saccharibacteria bacterium]|nr:cytosine methyltransferase [Candidatus Saccharibacteria bacterium]